MNRSSFGEDTWLSTSLGGFDSRTVLQQHHFKVAYRKGLMKVLETRGDGTILCVLTPDEVSTLKSNEKPRKWLIRGITKIPGVFASNSAFEFIMHAKTREEAEAFGTDRILKQRKKAVVVDVGAKDVTGKVQGLFGWS